MSYTCESRILVSRLNINHQNLISEWVDFLKADLISDDLIFTGGGEECEMFIVSVKKQAFRAGKATDNAWSAQFAGTCFAGAALRWYEGLDDVTQNDWGLLRKALLARYPAAKSDSIIST